MVRPLTSSQQAEALSQWLAHYGFEANPFGECEANRESRLPEYFVATPYYDEILGLSDPPRTMVIYAPRGCGKTAHRVMVARACRPLTSNSSVLAIEYTDFGTLPYKMTYDSSAITLREHVGQILRSGVRAVIETITRDPALVSSLLPEWLARLKWFCRQYNPTVLEPTELMTQLRMIVGSHFAPDWREFQQAWQAGRLGEMLVGTPIVEQPAAQCLVALADVHPKLVEAEHLSQAQVFSRFVDLVRHLKLKAVYVLVDRVDEPGELARDMNLAASFIAPLLADLPLMECSHAAFKFFLPLEMHQALKSKPGVRLDDRLPYRCVVWKQEALRTLLKERLLAFSNGRVEELAALSDETLQHDIDAAIVRQARGIPRNMLRLGDALFTAHCHQAGGELLLSRSDWDVALSEFDESTYPPLSLDLETRTVYVGPQEIRLSGALFDLLEYLYKRPGLVVGNADLLDLVGSLDSIRKRISRIRAAIEPDPENPVYLITAEGSGYRLNVYHMRSDEQSYP